MQTLAVTHKDVQAIVRLHKRAYVAVKRRGLSTATKNEIEGLNRVQKLIDRLKGIQRLFN